MTTLRERAIFPNDLHRFDPTDVRCHQQASLDILGCRCFAPLGSNPCARSANGGCEGTAEDQASLPSISWSHATDSNCLCCGVPHNLPRLRSNLRLSYVPPEFVCRLSPGNG